MIVESLNREEYLKALLEYFKNYFLDRAYTLKNQFYTDFYAQAIENIGADLYEIFFEMPLEYNYFKEHFNEINDIKIMRLFKLSGVYYTIRIVKKRKKDLFWEDIKKALFDVYDLSDDEIRLTEILQDCSLKYQNLFNELFIKTTVRYAFFDNTISLFSFAFIGNFWYNSYSSFIGIFGKYIPFSVRLKRATG